MVAYKGILLLRRARKYKTLKNQIKKINKVWPLMKVPLCRIKMVVTSQSHKIRKVKERIEITVISVKMEEIYCVVTTVPDLSMWHVSKLKKKRYQITNGSVRNACKIIYLFSY